MKQSSSVTHDKSFLFIPTHLINKNYDQIQTSRQNEEDASTKTNSVHSQKLSRNISSRRVNKK